MRRYSSDIFKPKFYPKPDFTRIDFNELPPEPVHDYKHFSQYPSWPDPYKRNRPFFTKDSLDSFIKPIKGPVVNNLPIDNNEEQVNPQQQTTESDKTAEELLQDIINENNEFYREQAAGVEQNVTYPNGADEINNALANAFPSFEINHAIKEVQGEDLSQHEIDSQVNPANEEVLAANQPYDNLEDYTNQTPESISEAQPEIVQDQMMPLVDEAMGDGMPQQNLEQIVQEEQGMMGEPPGIFAPEYFGL